MCFNNWAVSLRHFAIVLLMSVSWASAEDWPQWQGPNRDNVWHEEGIVDRFPVAGPAVQWRAAIAGGYAGPAVADGRVFVTDYVPTDTARPTTNNPATPTGVERVHCLNVSSGETLWQHSWPVAYTISYPAGPRCTPLVEDDRVYVLGAEGDLLCLAVEDGQVMWQKNLREAYRTKAATWGYASHPLIDGDRLICIAGTDVAHAVALNKHTGEEIWRTGTAAEQGYCPPLIIEAAGVRQLILMHPDGMYAVAPETGERLWETPYNADNGSIIMQPVRIDDYLFIGGFQEKNLLLKLRQDIPGVEVVWRNKRQHGISAVNVQPFVLDGHLCGFHEKGDLRVVAIPSGEVVFSSGGPLPGRLQGCGTAFITRHKDRFFLFTETGDLVIAELSPEGYRELDRCHLIDPSNTAFGRDVVWSPPAYADRSVFVRNDQEIVRVALTAPAPADAGGARSSASQLTFDQHIRPILKAACTHCHGEEEPIAGGVDLRLRRFLLAESESGVPAIVPGNPEASRLVQVIETGEMPAEGKPLSPEQIATIRAWVAAGALVEEEEPESLPAGAFISRAERKHWSFQPILEPPVPISDKGERVRTPVDAFLLARLQAEGLSFAADTDRATLLRRVTFDLTGLPPTPDEVIAFLNDPADDAYERAVDRLLASPAYGQRWARHWLDIAGYADSNGQVEADSLRPHAWRYRDYVVDSLNADRPWDQFLTEQLAGDELAEVVHGETSDAVQDPARRELLIATGFLRTAPDGTGDNPPDAVLARNDAVAEQLKVVSSAVLGLTVGCAQCHDHRFDPITQVDYYRLRAIFEPAFDTAQWRVPAQRLCSLATPEDQAKAAEIEKQAAAIDADAQAMQKQFLDEIFEKEILKLPEEDREPYRTARATPKAEQTPEQKALIKKYPSALALYSLDLYDPEAQKKVAARRAEATELRKTKPKEAFLRVLTEVRNRIPETPLLHRGDPAQPRETTAPGELTVLAGSAVTPFEPAVVEGGSSGRRLAYARWLVSGEHPLVARVLVNRFWMHHFGEGLVASEGDFGLAGEPPSHPALLDWLASRFMAEGWQLKPLHRMLVTSTAYRQQARSAASEKIDPENRLLGRWSVRRLDAESIRDAMLAASLRLSSEAGGPSVNVGRDELGRIVLGQEQYNVNGDIVGISDAGAAAARRSLYVLNRRSTPLTALATFDAPSMLPNCEQRTSSTVAPQSLFMLNDTFVLESSQALAARLRAEHPGDLRGQLTRAWLLLTAHEPMADDLADGLVFIAEQTESLRQRHAATAEASPSAEDAPTPDPQAEAIASYCQVLLSSTRFLYVE